MPLRDAFNQVKHKLEDLNRQHNIIPLGQNQNQHQQQQAQYPQQGYQQQGYPGQQYQQQYPQQQQYYPPPQQGQQQQWGQPPPQQQYYPPPQQGYSNPQQQHSDRPPPPVPMHSRPSDIGTQHHQQPPPPADSSCPVPPALSAPGTYWHPVFSPSNLVSTEWHHEQGNGNNGWGNAELENYTNSPQNSFHTPDAKLVLRALSDPDHPDPAQRYTSARLVSRHTLQRHRGVLTTWLSLPCAEGIWPAFWLLPKEPMTWPHDGEVDIAESWNGDCENHSCLHWGFYNAEDHNKHLVKATKIPDMHTGRAIRYDFAWDCASTGGKAPGRFMWYIDGRPVMKNMMPEGTRSIDDWCIIINVAMGGNVCQGKTPAKGQYDMVVHDVKMCEEPEGGGWSKFEQDWYHCPDGGLM